MKISPIMDSDEATAQQRLKEIYRRQRNDLSTETSLEDLRTELTITTRLLELKCRIQLSNMENIVAASVEAQM
ncbi:MAG: hypothetical protein WAV41_01195 [Microgenomates group bacterium]